MVKFPEKIHMLELKESTNCLIAENVDFIKNNL